MLISGSYFCFRCPLEGYKSALFFSYCTVLTFCVKCFTLAQSPFSPPLPKIWFCWSVRPRATKQRRAEANVTQRPNSVTTCRSPTSFHYERSGCKHHRVSASVIPGPASRPVTPPSHTLERARYWRLWGASPCCQHEHQVYQTSAVKGTDLLHALREWHLAVRLPAHQCAYAEATAAANQLEQMGLNERWQET